MRRFYPKSFSLAPVLSCLKVGWVLALLLLLLLGYCASQWLDIETLGWAEGFNHPLSGWDHLLTMLAVGVWAAQLRGHAIWQLPLAFVGVMTLGGMAGAAGLSIPSVEGIILLSCAVLVLLISRKVRFNAKINVLLVAFFGFFHGFAHGHEINASASLLSYTLGFVLATLLLHGAGILVAKLVVLALSALLALLLSSTALAKTDSAILTTVKPATQSTQAFSQTQFFDSAGTSHSRFKYQAGTHPSEQPLMAYNPPDTQQFAAPASLLPGVWLFKQFYPLINHTPGLSLSSNGVGLTSPPLLLTPVPLLVPTRFPRSTPNSNLIRFVGELNPLTFLFSFGLPYAEHCSALNQCSAEHEFACVRLFS